jgi:hypothetical protein
MKDEAELLWRMCNEEYSQARQHETQRASMTTIGVTLSVAAIGFITFDSKLSAIDLPLALIVVGIGVFGFFFTLKHYERFQFHIERSRVYRGKLEGFYPAADIGSLRSWAESKHKKKFPRLFQIRLYWFWLGIHASIGLLGLIVLGLVLYRITNK